MLSPRPSKQIVGALVACALCFSSTAAAAATLPTSSAISPWVALSSLSTPASAAAVCTAGAAAVTAAQAPSGGCVLPVVDQPPPVPAPTATPAVAPIVEHEGIGLLPILLGLAAIAGIVALLLTNGDDDDNGNEPISPA